MLNKKLSYKVSLFVVGIFVTLFVLFTLVVPLDTLFVKPAQSNNVVVSTPAPIALNSDKLWETVNNWRTSQNLPVYVKNEQLCIIADERVAYIQNDWSHNEFVENLSAYKNISGYKYLGENLSKNNFPETAALDAWLDSPGHLENLTLPFTHSCIATDGIFAVQIFGSY